MDAKFGSKWGGWRSIHTPGPHRVETLKVYQ